MKGGHGEKGTSKLIKQFFAIYLSVGGLFLNSSEDPKDQNNC